METCLIVFLFAIFDQNTSIISVMYTHLLYSPVYQNIVQCENI